MARLFDCLSYAFAPVALAWLGCSLASDGRAVASLFVWALTLVELRAAIRKMGGG